MLMCNISVNVTACGLKPPTQRYVESIDCDTVNWVLPQNPQGYRIGPWEPIVRCDTTWARKVQLWLTPEQRDILLKKIDEWLKPIIPWQAQNIDWGRRGGLRIDTAALDSIQVCAKGHDWAYTADSVMSMCVRCWKVTNGE